MDRRWMLAGVLLLGACGAEQTSSVVADATVTTDAEPDVARIVKSIEAKVGHPVTVDEHAATNRVGGCGGYVAEPIESTMAGCLPMLMPGTAAVWVTSLTDDGSWRKISLRWQQDAAPNFLA